MQNFINQAVKKALGIKKKTADSISTHTPNEITSNHPLAHMYTNRWNRATLEYPYDIQMRSDLGHYMMFYVNVPIATQYTGGKGETQQKIEGQNDFYGWNVGGSKWGNAIDNHTDSIIARSSAAFSMRNTEKGANSDFIAAAKFDNKSAPKDIKRTSYEGHAAKQLNTKRMTRTNECIVLYMPPQIGATYAAGWKDVEMGMVGGSKAVLGMGQTMMDSFGGATEEAITKQMEGLKKSKASEVFAEHTARKMGGGVGQTLGLGDVFTGIDKMANRALNNYLEAVFSGIGYRKFSYTWKFTPRDPEEAKVVDQIIRTFKFHMLPEYQQNSAGRYFTVPSEFELFYMYRGDENTWMNKIYTSVLTNMEVNYTPTQFQTLRPLAGRNGAPMSEMEMKLDFQETKLVTKEDILEGF